MGHPVVITLALVSIVYGALLAIGQDDVFRLVGLTSLSHFGLITLGIFTFSSQGGTGAILYMVNHGLGTAALFLTAGYLAERRGTTLISRMGGVEKVTPVLAGLLLVAGLATLGLPACRPSSASSSCSSRPSTTPGTSARSPSPPWCSRPSTCSGCTSARSPGPRSIRSAPTAPTTSEARVDDAAPEDAAAAPSDGGGGGGGRRAHRGPGGPPGRVRPRPRPARDRRGRAARGRPRVLRLLPQALLDAADPTVAQLLQRVGVDDGAPTVSPDSVPAATQEGED